MSSDCGKTRLDWMDTLAAILWNRPSFDHTWHIREQNKYSMHPAVREAVLIAPPSDWHRLVLEWPHVSTSDPARLAYTRSVQHGIDDRQTVTSISKYLALNFPSLASHIVRDICAKFGSHAFKISWEMDEMLELLHASPKTCMRWDNWKAGEWHPYQCYSPDFGWGLAVRLENDIPMARALVNKNSMNFVRSFGAVDNDRGHAQSDNALNSYLKSIGYEHAYGWDGLKLARIDHPDGGLTAPYLDGNSQHVNLHSSYMLISDCGEYECTATDGSIEEDEDRTYCEDCDDTINTRHDNYLMAGRYEDRTVCESCSNDSYVYAYGAGGNQYHVHYDDCTNIGDDYYVDRYFADNDIVYAMDIEEHCKEDDCVYLDSRSEYVSSDCSYAVYCENSGTHEHKNDCVIDDDGNYTLIDNQSSEAAA
jgi:hypothetical protein